MVLSDNDRHANLDIVDYTVENNPYAVENNTENENIEKNDGENNGTTADNNEWIILPKKVSFAERNEDVRVTRSGRPIMSEDRSEVGRIALSKTKRIVVNM